MTVRYLLRLALPVALALAAARAFGQEAAKAEDPRIKQAREELQTAKDMLAEVTNETERATWQQRAALAEKEIANAERLIGVEQRERSLSTEHRHNVDYALREALATVDPSTTAAETIVRERNAEIRRLKAQRSQLESMREPGAQNTDEEIRAGADLAAHIRNVDEEILARTLEREAAELKLRVVRETVRIETFLRELNLNPRPTIQLIVHKKQGLKAVRNARAELDLMHQALKNRHDGTVTAFRLTQERSGQLDESIAILQDRLRVEKQARPSKEEEAEKYNKQIRLRRMLNTSKSEKLLIQQRIKHIEDQYEALKEAVATAEQGRNLLDAEIAFLNYDLEALKKRFYQVITVPGGIVLALLIGYLVISRLIFPLVVAHEHLFLTRRLASYVVLILVIAVLVAFFLEDLKAIATVMGIVGAAVVIALQDLCSSFAGWFVIVASRKISVGDRVEIDGHRGDVVDIQMLRTTLLELHNWLGADEPTGRVLVVPNSFIFKSHLFNYTFVHPHIWNKFDITVTFETPPTEAYDLLLRVLTEETTDQFEAARQGEARLARKYGLSHAKIEPRIHTFIADSGVCFSLYYVAHYKHVTGTRDKISARILKEFENNKRMQFAYPTQRHIPTPESGGLPVTVTKEAAGKH